MLNKKITPEQLQMYPIRLGTRECDLFVRFLKELLGDKSTPTNTKSVAQLKLSVIEG